MRKQGQTHIWRIWEKCTKLEAAFDLDEDRVLAKQYLGSRKGLNSKAVCTPDSWLQTSWYT